jgi:CelD/BcsL family acetyltransferase involved in cellulose biosynthesis
VPEGQDPIVYEVLETLPQVEAIYREWTDLLWRSPCNRAFSSPTWFLVACRTQPQCSPYVLVARRGPRIAGILPLALQENNTAAIFPSRMSNYNDVIAEAEDLAVVAGLIEYARTSPRPYQQITFWWVPSGANCLRAMPALAECFTPTLPYFFLPLPSSYEEFLQSKSRAFRKGVYRAKRKATEDGLELRQLDPDSFPPEYVPELFLSLNYARFGEESAFWKHPPNADFARLALPTLFAEKQMVVFALLQGKEIIGIDLSMVGSESFCTWNGGYPPEAEPWSPGRLLIDAGIRRAFELGLKEYDFLRGPQEWKKSWSNQSRTVGHIELSVST